MPDIPSAFRRPFSEPKRFWLCALLSLFPISLAGFIFLWGYFIECVRSTLAGEEGLPAWEGIVDLLKDGGFGVLITASYLLPGTLLMVASIGNPLAPNPEPNTLVVLASALLILLGSYLLGAAITHATRTGRWRDGYAFLEIVRIAFRPHYFLAAVLSLCLATAITGVYLAFSLIPFVGWILATAASAILGPYVGIVSITLIASAAME